MDGIIEQSVCVNICVELGKSATENLEMHREAFGDNSLSQIVV
jgi:hypothetical protein